MWVTTDSATLQQIADALDRIATALEQAPTTSSQHVGFSVDRIGCEHEWSDAKSRTGGPPGMRCENCHAWKPMP